MNEPQDPKRPNGGLKNLGGDRYRLRAWGPDLDGNFKQYSTQFRAGTKKKLDDKVAAFRNDAKRGVFADRDRQNIEAARKKAEAESATSRTTTLATYAARWLRIREASGSVGEKTMARYGGIVRDQIGKTLGPMMLGNITPAAVNDAIATWRTMPRGDRKTGHLSARTVHHALSTLTAVLASAVDEDILTRNPAAKISVRKSDEREVNALDAAQSAQLIAGLRGTMLEVPVTVAIGTGLRRGEILAMRWNNVHLDAEKPYVDAIESLEHRTDGTLHFKQPKTKKSRRSVPLGPSVVAALRAHRFAQAQSGLVFGDGFNADRLVFPWIDGTPWNPGDFSMRFYRTVRKLKLPIVSFHDLRHTFASISLRNGIPIKIVSDTLGHTNISITADRYTHSVPAHHVEAIALVDAAIAGAIEAHDAEGRV